MHSPFYNDNKLYPTNAECEWNLIGPIDHYLRLHFNKLDLNASRKPCNESDYVSIAEVNPAFLNKKTELGIYCGSTNPDDITTSSNQVSVHFKTGPNAKRLNGFSLSFNATQDRNFFIIVTYI